MARRRPTRRRARPPLGQHFLQEPRIRSQILSFLYCRPKDCWVELGAGRGEMTLALAEASRALAAVERDPRLAETLRGRLKGLPHARVVEADILQVSFAALSEELGCERLRVYGNLPYYITSPILQHLFRFPALLADIHVVVQQEVGHRLVATPGGRDYGYLSVLTQWHSTPEILLSIPRGAFRPPPGVDSALVRLVPPGKSAVLDVREPEAFLGFVAACFRQKRKTLRNNLRGTFPSQQVEAALAASALEPRARAEELSLQAFARLYQVLTRRGGTVVPSHPL